MLAALRAEGRRVDREVPTRYHVRNGRCTGSAKGAFRYQFRWDREPEGSVPGYLRIGRKRVYATVGRADPGREGVVDLLVEKFLGDTVESAKFYADPTFLLRMVHDRLDGLRAQGSGPDDVLRRFSNRGASGLTASSHVGPTLGGLNSAQQAAVRIAAHSPLSFIWGPPGTGKTRTIGALVGALRDQGKRVLVLSPYNVAVDEAVLSVARWEPDRLDGVIRVGRSSAQVRDQGLDLDSRLEKVAAESGLLGVAQQLVAALTGTAQGVPVSVPDSVHGCLDELGGWLVRHRSRARAQVTAVNQALARLRDAFRQPEGSILAAADVLATTLTLRVLNRSIWALDFDHVVIDEGSVVRTPEMILAAAVNPEAYVTVAGDPRQLPAIVRERNALTDEWLARSPFALAGISEPEEATGACVLLTEQHRMAPRIRRVVSEQFYKGRLTDGAVAHGEGEVILLDSNGPECRSMVSMFGRRYSKANPHHRMLVAEALHTLRKREPDGRILVLTPFTAQRRLYAKEATTALYRELARFETIHAGQGSEQDTVVIDLVLAGESAGRSSRMLRDTKSANPYLANLLNVALSRARRRLVVLADLELVRTELNDGVLAQVLKRVAAAGSTVHLREYPRPAAGVRDALREVR